ncbi:MAG: RpiB/LacA/LacB family sugar-phosphate isomerase [Patescibacteria group bacterium]
MKIFIGSDHAGFELKGKLISFLIKEGYEVLDKGAFEYKKEDDYPDFVSEVAREISQNPHDTFGFVLGGSGQGEAIVANRFPHIRATVYYGGALNTISLAREHNNANILSLGARFIKDEEAINAVRVFLNTPFSRDERHVRRIRKIDDI